MYVTRQISACRRRPWLLEAPPHEAEGPNSGVPVIQDEEAEAEAEAEAKHVVWHLQ